MTPGENSKDREARLAQALRSNLRRRKAGGGGQPARPAPESTAAASQPEPVKRDRD